MMKLWSNIIFDSKGRLEGEVVKIIKRNNTELVGIISRYRGKYIVKPLDYKNPFTSFY